MLQIIKLIVKFDYEIFELEYFDGVYCENLLYCTDFWISHDNTKFKPNVVREFFVDKYAVELIYNTFKQYKSTIKPYRKIYLYRKGARVVLNQNEIDFVLKEFNIESVDTASLTFLEQIKLFSEALFVVGSSGAAFSNIIFMNKLSKAIIFTPNCRATNFYVFQQMADVSGVDLLHILSTNKLKNDT